ncbi:MAG: metal ABC transporter permease [Limnochordales bacterium]|nr:metal ABC transporter permease [Limnochordales bacterium]
MLSYVFMQRALLASVGIGVLTSLAGFFVVHRHLAFAGDGIAHSIFGGVALALVLGVSPFIGGAIFSLAIALAIAATSRRGSLSEDSAIGIFFSATMALGTVLIARTPGYIDLFSFLFGNILAVTVQDLYALLVAGSVILLFFVLQFHNLMAVAFSPELAEVDGKPVALLDYGLMLAIAGVVVLAVRMVGIVLVSALLVIPPATARLWARHYKSFILITLAVNLTSSLGGLLLSFFFDLPSGGTIVLLGTALFLISLLIHRLPLHQPPGRHERAA